MSYGKGTIFSLLIASTISLALVGVTSSFAQSYPATQSGGEQNQSGTQEPMATGATTNDTLTASAGGNNNTLSGFISSVQLDQRAAPQWITAGEWQIESDGNLFANDTGANITDFHATVLMTFLTNGTLTHQHEITDFSQTGIFYSAQNATVVNGTMTVTMDGEPIENVHGYISLQNDKFEVWLEPVETEQHFGVTPVYGMIRGQVP